VEGLEAEFQQEFVAAQVDAEGRSRPVVGVMTERTTSQRFHDAESWRDW